MLADGHSYSEIGEKLTCTDRYISAWKLRFKQDRLAGLDSRYRGAEYRRRTAQTEARILEFTRRGPHRILGGCHSRTCSRVVHIAASKTCFTGLRHPVSDTPGNAIEVTDLAGMTSVGEHEQDWAPGVAICIGAGEEIGPPLLGGKKESVVPW
jgi:hypothetical protein